MGKRRSIWFCVLPSHCMATNATSLQTREVTPLEITIGIGAEEIKEIIMEHIKTKGFNVTEDDISFVIGKEETVTGNAKKIKHALIRCDIQIER
jgi:hypothetical protein